MHTVERRRALPLSLAAPLGTLAAASLSVATPSAGADTQAAARGTAHPGATGHQGTAGHQGAAGHQGTAARIAAQLPEDVVAGLRALDDMRRDAVDAAAPEDALPALARYLGQLVRLPSRFPLDAAAVERGDAPRISFAWFPSPSVLRAPAKTPVIAHDVRAEAASVVFNIGAAASEMAAAQPEATADGLRRACALYMLAACALADVARMYAPAVGSSSAPDLAQPALEALASALCAQAQACCYLRAALPGAALPGAPQTSEATLARVARAAADMYAGARALAASSGLRWASSLEAHAALFRALACRHRAAECLAAAQYGREIQALAEAQAHAADALAVAKAALGGGPGATGASRLLGLPASLSAGSLPAVFPADLSARASTLAVSLDADLARAQRDNKLIYHDTVPQGAVLGAIVPAALVTPPRIASPGPEPTDAAAAERASSLAPDEQMLAAFHAQSLAMQHPAAASLGLPAAFAEPFVLASLAPPEVMRARARLADARSRVLAECHERTTGLVRGLDAAASLPEIAAACASDAARVPESTAPQSAAPQSTPANAAIGAELLSEDRARVPDAAVHAAEAVARAGGVGEAESLRDARDAARGQCIALLRDAMAALDEEAAADAHARATHHAVQRAPSQQLNALLLNRIAESRQQLDAAARADAYVDNAYATHMPLLIALSAPLVDGELEAVVPPFVRPAPPESAARASDSASGPMHRALAAQRVALDDLCGDARSLVAAHYGLRARIAELSGDLVRSVHEVDASLLESLPETDTESALRAALCSRDDELNAVAADVDENVRALHRLAAELGAARSAADAQAAAIAATDAQVARDAQAARDAEATRESPQDVSRRARVEAVRALVAAQRVFCDDVVPRLREGAAYYASAAEGPHAVLVQMCRDYASGRAAELQRLLSAHPQAAPSLYPAPYASQPSAPPGGSPYAPPGGSLYSSHGGSYASHSASPHAPHGGSPHAPHGGFSHAPHGASSGDGAWHPGMPVHYSDHAPGPHSDRPGAP